MNESLPRVISILTLVPITTEEGRERNLAFMYLLMVS